MNRARIYLLILAVSLLSQGYSPLALPWYAVVGLILTAAGATILECWIERYRIDKIIERFEVLEKTTAEVFNQLNNRMSQMEAHSNLIRSSRPTLKKQDG